MYNIAITKENETKFYDGADGKPRQYPTLADALVSAQYLGLTRQDVELHFVKEGASAEAITQTTTAMAKPRGGKTKGNKDNPAVSEPEGGGQPMGEMNHPADEILPEGGNAEPDVAAAQQGDTTSAEGNPQS